MQDLKGKLLIFWLVI